MAPPPFPNNPWLAGFMAPCRFEVEACELTVQGTIPPELDGTFYRVMPDPAMAGGPPEASVWFHGGEMTMFAARHGFSTDKHLLN
jgi:carotenoid cleavage dioxygenase-like enzyme